MDSKDRNIKHWSSTFGENYIFRNPRTVEEYEQVYKTQTGKRRFHLLHDMIFCTDYSSHIDKVLEVGCNIGLQLELMYRLGFKQLYGVDVNQKAINSAKTKPYLCCMYGEAQDLPFKDDYFDLVFTSGLLIHIPPEQLTKVLYEICRTSKKYIMGYEYFNDKEIMIPYRGKNNMLWKNDWVKQYLEVFPGLEVLQEVKIPLKDNSGNYDIFFLLEKPIV